MMFVSPLKFNMVDSSIHITPLAFSSKKSGTENPPVYFNAGRNWTSVDFTKGSVPVAAAVSGRLNGNLNSEKTDEAPIQYRQRQIYCKRKRSKYAEAAAG